MWKALLISLTLVATCLAAPERIEQRATRLRTVLQQADDAYYNRGEAILSDEAYDALREQYNELQRNYSDLPAYDHVGAAVSGDATPVPHSRPMLSLQKAYTDEEVEKFLSMCGPDAEFCLSPKIDGLTVVFRYLDGRMVQAVTRGDGKEGMDVTAQVMAAGCVPLVLTNAPKVLEVRGEAFVSYVAFDALNGRRTQDGQHPLKSPRNSAAGTLRMKDLPEVARRGLSCRIFEVVDSEPMPATQINGLAQISLYGLPVVECRMVPATEVLQVIEEINRQRSGLAYPTDGIVIKLNDRAAFERMGTTARWPKGALARKYRAVPVETRLLGVEWMRGEHGRLTPVARFEPVGLDGATLQRASLYSKDHLLALDLMIGDRIQVVRAGGAIPEIIGRCPGPRSGDETPIPAPPED